MNQGIPVCVVVLFAGLFFVDRLQENHQVNTPVAMILGGLVVGWAIRISRKESQ
jgi:hypothetical protein